MGEVDATWTDRYRQARGRPSRRVQPGYRVAGRYRLLERLYESQYSSVWRALDEYVQTTVAVKLLRPAAFLDPDEALARVCREYDLAKAAHEVTPRVVKVFDRGEDEVVGRPYLVSQYMPGGSLEHYLKVHSVIRPEQALLIARVVAETLDALHAAGVVHRDVKPANFVLDSRGVPYITDFGLGRDSDAASEGLTEDGKVRATLDYASPEALRAGPATPASDNYSYGVVVYELLTGKRPFAGASWVDVAVKQVTDDPPAPSAVNPDVPVGADSVLLRMLDKDPTGRWRSAMDMVLALAGALGLDLPSEPDLPEAATIAEERAAHDAPDAKTNVLAAGENLQACPSQDPLLYGPTGTTVMPAGMRAPRRLAGIGHPGDAKDIKRMMLAILRSVIVLSVLALLWMLGVPALLFAVPGAVASAVASVVHAVEAAAGFTIGGVQAAIDRLPSALAAVREGAGLLADSTRDRSDEAWTLLGQVCVVGLAGWLLTTFAMFVFSPWEWPARAYARMSAVVLLALLVLAWLPGPRNDQGQAHAGRLGLTALAAASAPTPRSSR
jgi:eukaryotic-like serine/threonine-protein kinase